MMWFSTSGRTMVLPPTLGILLWACTTLAWSPGEKKDLRKIREISQRHDDTLQDHLDAFAHPNPLEGSCVDHDAGCPVFAAMAACDDPDISKLCVASCTDCVPMCLDLGYGCAIIKMADLCNKYYAPICKKTCGVCTDGTTSTQSTTSTTSATTSSTTSATTSSTTSPTSSSTTSTTSTSSSVSTSPTTSSTTSATTSSTTSTTSTSSSVSTSPTTSSTTSATPSSTTSPTTISTTIMPAECNHPSASSVNTCDFSTFSASHSIHLPQKSSCAITKSVISTVEKAEILRVHNEFRAKVAKGEETLGNPGGQPSGSNIRELTWSDELALVATAWAKQCPHLQHDTYSNRRTCYHNIVGQNIYYTWTNKPESVWERGIRRWYNEVKDVPRIIVPFYTDHAQTIGHYTQLVWGETTLIGCGAVTYETTFRTIFFKHAKIYVCNYATGGNILGSPIYEEGPAATNCGDGFVPSSCNPGLCSKLEGTKAFAVFYRFLDMVYSVDLNDPNSQAFKDLKKTLEEAFSSEYSRLLGALFVNFIVKEFSQAQGSLIIEGILIVRQETTIPNIIEATGNLIIDGGLDVSKPEDIFKPPTHLDCKFTANVPALIGDYSRFGDKHTANLGKNCSCGVHKVGLTLAEKIEILTTHNNYRSKVAQGKETRGNPAPQPTGANIKELVWNNQLAEVAQAWANRCPFLRHDTYGNRRTSQYGVIGQNIYYTWSNKAESVWTRGIGRWYNEVARVPKILVGYYAEHRETIGHYTQMLWAETTEIGCGAISYRTEFRGFVFKHAKIYVCNYGPGGNILGRPIYLQGPAATKCNGDISETYPQLCAAMPASTGTVTQRPPVTSGPVVTSEPGTCKFKAATDDYTSGCDYATRYNDRHSANLMPNCSCEVHRTGMGTLQKANILRIHNQFRSLVARGEETRGNPGPQPPGANIKQLTWSDQLAELAQAWANQCPFLKHDTYSNRATCDFRVVGQNIYYSWSNKDESVWERGITRWYNEVKDLTTRLVDLYAEDRATIGHYTQMIWAETSHIGCGQVHYKTHFRNLDFDFAKIYVCNYGPGGNILGKPIYDRGVAATQCDDSPSTTFPDLCEMKVNIPLDSKSVLVWYVFKDQVFNPALSDKSSPEFRNLKLLHQLKFTEEYRRTLGDKFVSFEVVAFHEGSVIIEAILIVKKFALNTDIEAATLILIIPGGLDLSDIQAIFVRPSSLSTTTVSTDEPQCEFKAIVPDPMDGCDFSMFSNSHSVNLPVNCSCAVHKIGVTQEDKDEILRIHNDYRVKVARGKEMRGNPGAQPNGANIMELIWSDELAQSAQAWANQCPFLRHDRYINRRTCTFPVVGQNIYYTWSNRPDSVWVRGIRRWYNEVAKMTNLLVDFYAENRETIGHYTQMIWGETARIGCGAVHYETTFRNIKFKEAKVYVCNYGPAGNILGKPIYLRGEPASQCIASKSENYPDLCESTIFRPPVAPTVKPEDCDFTAPVPELSEGCDYSLYGDAHTGNLRKNCSCHVHTAGVTDTEKEEILRAHNGYRAKVARGDETRGNPGPQPHGSNILELIWNDQLAEVAQMWANQCPFLQHDTYPNRQTCIFPVVGQNIYYTWTNSTESLWERGIGRWFNEVARVSKTLVDFYAENDETIGHYTQVLWAESAEIGCGAVIYKTTFREFYFSNARIYVCNYGPAGNILGKHMYQKGDAATECIIMPSINYPDLCESTRRPAPTPSPTQPPVVCKFSATVNLDNENICDYRQIFPTTHTARLPKNCSCEVHKLGVSDSEKEEILGVHNQYRQKVALGLESRGNPAPQYHGSNIVELKWDDQLAHVAQAWANQCPYLRHDTYVNRKTCLNMVVGQNIYYTWSNDSNSVWEKGIDRWYNEVQNVPNFFVNLYLEHDATIGHYTQMLWAETTHIGCGAVVYKTNFYRGLKKYYFTNAKIYVCNYGPAGNILGEPVYKIGTAASDCPNPNKVSAYSGLCGQ